MMKKLLIIVAVVVLAWLGYSMLYPRQQNPGAAKPNENVSGGEAAQPVTQANEYAVVYENGAFAPALLKIRVGDTVNFTNKHSATIRIPSGPHPTHTSMPEFDSDTLASGESYSFTFTKPGTLNYHNHFNPSVKGQVVTE